MKGASEQQVRLQCLVQTVEGYLTSAEQMMQMDIVEQKSVKGNHNTLALIAKSVPWIWIGAPGTKAPAVTPNSIDIPFLTES